MASIFRFVSPTFRTRSPLRDAATDLRRIAGLRAAIVEALESARREHDGLQQRLEGFQLRAATLFDDAPGYGERSAREERELAQAERQVIAATDRLQQLKSHIAHLDHVLASVEEDAPAAQRLGA